PFNFDETAPTITCPANVVQNNDPGLCSAVVNYPAPTGDDNCPGATVACAAPSGSVFPVGTTSVTCTATDSGGNHSSCTFNVTVNDADPPMITSVSASPDVLWPPNHKMVPVVVSATATDNCGSVPVCPVTSGSSAPLDPPGARGAPSQARALPRNPPAHQPRSGRGRAPNPRRARSPPANTAPE